MSNPCFSEFYIEFNKELPEVFTDDETLKKEFLSFVDKNTEGSFTIDIDSKIVTDKVLTVHVLLYSNRTVNLDWQTSNFIGFLKLYKQHIADIQGSSWELLEGYSIEDLTFED